MLKLVGWYKFRYIDSRWLRCGIHVGVLLSKCKQGSTLMSLLVGTTVIKIIYPPSDHYSKHTLNRVLDLCPYTKMYFIINSK